MNASLYIGVSSSLSHNKAVDIVGDNIANINTTGFKGSNAEFATLFEDYLATASTSPVMSNMGNGTRLSSASLDLTQGALQSSESTFHMAINGEGWFGVTNSNIYNADEVSYTRDGTFSVNRDRYLVNASGNYLLGSDYGILKQADDGSYLIDTEATPAIPSSDTTLQSPLLAPNELIYPHTTTTGSTLQKNLYTESATRIASADGSSLVSSLLDNSGQLISPKEGENLLFSVGTEDAAFVNDAIEYTLTLNDDSAATANSAAFTLNGTALTASWDEGASAAVIAAAITDTINAGNTGVTAGYQNGQVTLRSSESILLNNSDYDFIQPVALTTLSYSESPTGSSQFSTLDEMKDIIQSQIDTIYGSKSATAFMTASGRIEVAAKNDNIVLGFTEASKTNGVLLNNLEPLNGTVIKNTISTTGAFNLASDTSYQKIYDENGDEKLLYVTMTQTAPKDETGSTWEADLKIVSQEGATELTNADELVLNDKNIGLKNGQDLWVSVGNGDVRKSTFGYDYALQAPQDIPDGQASTLSFTINNTPVEVTITDGSSQSEAAGQIAAALTALGFSATPASEEVLIHGDETMPTLSIANGTSSFTDYTIPSHTLQYAQFGGSGESGFSTLEELSGLINSASLDANLALSAAIENSRLGIQNSGDSALGFRLYGGMDANMDLLNMLTPTYDPITAGNRVTTGELMTHTVQSETSQTITFDETAQLTSSDTITIQNGTKELTVDLSGLSNFDEAVYNEFFTQNGDAEGNFELYDINQEGQIIAGFTNGKNAVIGQVQLYHFQNDQGLAKVGGNQFIETPNSGDAFFYTDANGNVFNGSVIQNKQVEASNVSTGSALTEMIVLQRAFEGAAKIITTSDQLLQNAINMKK